MLWKAKRIHFISTSVFLKYENAQLGGYYAQISKSYTEILTQCIKVAYSFLCVLLLVFFTRGQDAPRLKKLGNNKALSVYAHFVVLEK